MNGIMWLLRRIAVCFKFHSINIIVKIICWDGTLKYENGNDELNFKNDIKIEIKRCADDAKIIAMA